MSLEGLGSLGSLASLREMNGLSELQKKEEAAMGFLAASSERLNL